MSKIELKPCPFCGGEAKMIKIGGATYFIQCNECHSTSGAFSTSEEAVEAWNKRAQHE